MSKKNKGNRATDEPAAPHTLQGQLGGAMLATADIPQTDPSSALPGFSALPDFEEVRSTREESARMARETEAAILAYLGKLEVHISDLVTLVRSVESESSETLRELRNAKEKAPAELNLLKHVANGWEDMPSLTPEQRLLRDTRKDAEAAARYVYALAMAKAPLKKWQAESLIWGGDKRKSSLPGLVEANFGLIRLIIKDGARPPEGIAFVEEVAVPKGGAVTVELGHDSFLVLPGRKREEAVKLAEALKKSYDAAVQAGRDYFNELLAKLREVAKPDVTLLQLGDFEPGSALFSVPPKVVPGRDRPLGGGYLAVQSNGKVVKAVGGVGHLQKIVHEMVVAEVAIPVEAIHKPGFFFKGNYDTVRLQRILHDMVVRALPLVEAEAKKKASATDFHKSCDAELEVLKAEATTSDVDALHKDVKGMAAISLPSWTVGEKKYARCMGLVEFRPGTVRLVKYPERLSGLFGTKFAQPMEVGEKFSGVPYPLGQILRNVFSATLNGRSTTMSVGGQKPSDPDELTPEKMEKLRQLAEQGKVNGGRTPEEEAEYAAWAASKGKTGEAPEADAGEPAAQTVAS